MIRKEERTLRGQIIYISGIINKHNRFTKREFVIKTDDEDYPQEIKCEILKEKYFHHLDGRAEGDFVVVSFNLKGRSWVNPKGETIYFNTIESWKIAITSELDSQQARDNKMFETIDEAKAYKAKFIDKPANDLPF